MTRRSPLALFATASALASLAACATPPRPHRGDINLVYGLTGQRRALFEVQQGRIISQWLDVATQSPAPDSCVRGTWNKGTVSLCPKELDPADSHFGGRLVQWQGPTGLLAIEVSPQGDAVRIDGHISSSTGAGTRSSDASAAGSSAGLVHSNGRHLGPHDSVGFDGDRLDAQRGGDGHPVIMHVTLPLQRGPQWDEIRRYPVLYALAAASIGIVRGEDVPKSKQPSETRAGDSKDAEPGERAPSEAPPAAAAPPEPTGPAPAK